MVQRTDLPWAIYSRNAAETARYLIQQAGGVDEAHKAVTVGNKANPDRNLPLLGTAI
jgi:hypothetical protein